MLTLNAGCKCTANIYSGQQMQKISMAGEMLYKHQKKHEKKRLEKKPCEKNMCKPEDHKKVIHNTLYSLIIIGLQVNVNQKNAEKVLCKKKCKPTIN